MVSDFPSTGFTSIYSSVFLHGELRQILSAYAEGVLNKGWKDYAIQGEPKQTTFCVVERGEGSPMAVIYSISKTKSKKSNEVDYYRIFDGQKQVLRTNSFLEALAVFRELGKRGSKKSKKLKIIK